MKVIFFGTPVFAANVLSFLLDHGVHIVAIVTKPDRPKGRSRIPLATPVKLLAERRHPNCPIFQPEIASDINFALTLESFKSDLFVVVAYGEIIKQNLLNMPRLGCINLHASILPNYRGAAPIQRSIIEGRKETGITIMHMAKKMDAGDIIEQEKVMIDPNITAGELEKILCEVGSKLLLKVIEDFKIGKILRIPQNHEKATFAPKIELEDCQINWGNSALEIHNLIRGVTPYPGAWCYVNMKGQTKRLRVISTKLQFEASEGQPGKFVSSSKDGLVIQTGKGLITLTEIQLEGKKPMNIAEFLKGFPIDSFFLLT